jgi:hypothetical protein
MMDPALKAKWLVALRSGNYQQARQALRDDHEDGKFSYCCLGVFCEVAGAKWQECEGDGYDESYLACAPVLNGNRIGSPDDTDDLTPSFRLTIGMDDDAE